GDHQPQAAEEPRMPQSPIQLTSGEGEPSTSKPLTQADEPAQTSEAPADPAPEASAQAPRSLPEEQAPLPLEDAEAAELTMPGVSLTEAHAATSLVKVGDDFPDLRLMDGEGRQLELAGLMGQKLTVVVFWNGSQRASLEELGDLSRDVQPRY